MLNMGAVKSFDVYLDDPIEVYHVGDSIHGHVVVSLTKELAMRGIRVTLRGEGRVQWREKIPSMQDKKRTTTFRGLEQFLFERKTVWGKDANEEGEIPLLQAGQHTFTFAFQFPNDQSLPCSFECGKIASVRYYVQANMDISWAVDPMAERYFSFVGSPIDCNLPRYQKTVHAADRKTLCCCCCCARGPIALKAELQRSSYCPGEYVNIRTKLDNNSDKTMKLGVKLVQNVSIQAETPKRAHKSGSYEILSYTSPAVLPDQEYILQTARMIQIPVLPPSIHSHIIQVSYIIEVSLIVDDKSELEIYFPITIGNMPYIDCSPNSLPKEITYAHASPSSCGATTEHIQYDDGEKVTQLKPFSPLYVTLANVPLTYACNGSTSVKTNSDADSAKHTTVTKINSTGRDGVFIRVNSRQEYSVLPRIRAFHSNSNSSATTASSILDMPPTNDIKLKFPPQNNTPDRKKQNVPPVGTRTRGAAANSIRHDINNTNVIGNGFIRQTKIQPDRCENFELLPRKYSNEVFGIDSPIYLERELAATGHTRQHSNEDTNCGSSKDTFSISGQYV